MSVTRSVKPTGGCTAGRAVGLAMAWAAVA